MKLRILNLLLIGLLLTGSAYSGGIANAQRDEKKPEMAQKAASCISPAELELSNTMRRLWMEHVNWTWEYIVSATEGLADQKQVLARLLRNQQDLGDAIKPFYGKEAGDKLAELLREHILIAGKIIDAAKSGKQKEVEKLNKEWYRNADDIVRFLTTANPNWSVKELQTLFYRHLELVADAVTSRLKKDWDAYVTTSDLGEAHILTLADVLTKGIVKQFPERFGTPPRGR